MKLSRNGLELGKKSLRFLPNSRRFLFKYHTYTHTHTYTYTYTYTYVCIRIHTYIYIYIYAVMHMSRPWSRSGGRAAAAPRNRRRAPGFCRLFIRGSEAFGFCLLFVRAPGFCPLFIRGSWALSLFIRGSGEGSEVPARMARERATAVSADGFQKIRAWYAPSHG